MRMVIFEDTKTIFLEIFLILIPDLYILINSFNTTLIEIDLPNTILMLTLLKQLEIIVRVVILHRLLVEIKFHVKDIIFKIQANQVLTENTEPKPR